MSGYYVLKKEKCTDCTKFIKGRCDCFGGWRTSEVDLLEALAELTIDRECYENTNSESKNSSHE